MILVLIEHDRGELDPLSLRALTFARNLDQDVQGLVVGKAGASLATIVGQYGVKVLHLAAHKDLTDYTPMASGRALKDLVEKLKPAAVLAAGTPRGNEQLAHLAAFLDLPMAAECLEILLSTTADLPHKVARARWAGNLIEEANVYSQLLIATIVALSTEPESVAGPAANLAEFEPSLLASDIEVKVLSRDVGDTGGGVTLADAKVIISGGRGVGGPEGFAKIEELANLLGGAVGCSRVVTSSGWRPHKEQVGQTGTKVAPELYLAAGISGAMQHIAGMKNSKTIIAVNTDPEAPIFKYADYAIIGDLHQILPALTEAIRKVKA